MSEIGHTDTMAQRHGEHFAEVQPAAPPYALIELFFFAYRDFVADADRLLADLRFGRAHHRVLHFVSRHPGLAIAELLDILKITKQSLNRVLKELVEQDFITVGMGEHDRRQRRLTATAKGLALARRLVALQTRRIEAALADVKAVRGPDGHLAPEPAVAGFLAAMIDHGERASVQARLRSGVMVP